MTFFCGLARRHRAIHLKSSPSPYTTLVEFIPLLCRRLSTTIHGRSESTFIISSWPCAIVLFLNYYFQIEVV